MENLPDDFFTTSHQFTRKAYRDVYPAIDPSSKALSQSGKVVIVTGASKGLGQKGIAASFAKAGPKAIVIVARSAAGLADTEKDIHKINANIQVLAVPTDVVSSASVEALFAKVKEKFGTADVLVNNAGLAGGSGILTDVPVVDWWSNFELNVKGTFLVTREFLKLVGPTKAAVVVNISSGAAVSVVPQLSSYCLSKLAMAQLSPFISAEFPNVVSITASPGTVLTDMTLESFKRFAKDTPELIGGFCVWLATKEAAFLNGRYTCANWSVDELLQRKAEIVDGNKLAIGLHNTTLGTDQFS